MTSWVCLKGWTSLEAFASASLLGFPQWDLSLVPGVTAEGFPSLFRFSWAYECAFELEVLSQTVLRRSLSELN